MSDPEDRDAQALAAFLDGEDVALLREDAETIGLFRVAAGHPAPGSLPVRRTRFRTARWAVAYAVAASVVLGLLLRPAPPSPLPAGPTRAEREAAMAALAPSSGPPIQRLAALHVVAGRERVRLIAEVARGE